MSDNIDAAREDGTPDSKKRMRPETAALQLLELSGQTMGKRPRTETKIIGSTMATKKDVASQKSSLPPSKGRQEGQFNDASTETEDTSTRNGNGKSLGSGPATTKKSAEDAGNSVRDGQFDDASEEDVPDILFFGESQPVEPPRPPEHVSASAHVPPQQQQQQALPLQVAVPVLPYHGTSSGASQNPTPWFPPIAPVPHSSVPPIHIAPRPSQQRQRTFADGPLARHPNPLLEPESNVDDNLRLRPMPPVVADTEHRRFPVYRPLPTDILLGRGGGSNKHAGNEWFREFIQLYRPTYHRVEKFNKMQLATNLVNYVRHCGGRFLQKVKTPTAPQVSVWFEAGDTRAREKCSQCLREATAVDSGKQPSTAAARRSAGKKVAPKKKEISRKSNHQGTTTASANSTVTSQNSRSPVNTATSRRPSTTSTITTNATETDGLFCDEENPDNDDSAVLTI